MFRQLDVPTSTRGLAEWAKGEVGFESRVCPVDPDHRGGKRARDLSVVLTSTRVHDFVWTWYSECLVQDHVLEIFRGAGLTGYEIKPVKARFRHPLADPPPRLWELVVTGWGGHAPPESGIRLERSCPGCAYRHYSGCTDLTRLIDASAWDGSDFFMVWPLPKFIFVTDRVAQTIRTHNLRGSRLVPLGDLDCGDGFTPGGLRYYVPEERARQLGEPLGIY